MKIKNIIICITALASCIIAEEFSNKIEDEIDKIYRIPPVITTPDLIQFVPFAGVGMFVNQPTTNNPFLEIAVSDWWAGNTGTNIIKIYELDDYNLEYLDYIVPTNEPVVFFADTATNVFSFLHGDNNIMRYLPIEKHQLPMFHKPDRNWFRVSRDNGLLYEFTTNLWDIYRSVPDSNITNAYPYLLQTSRTITTNQSWRVYRDAREELLFLYSHVLPESILAYELNNPLNSSGRQDYIADTLYHRFGWRRINGVISPPPQP